MLLFVGIGFKIEIWFAIALGVGIIRIFWLVKMIFNIIR